MDQFESFYWSGYSLYTFGVVFLCALLAAIPGALAGWVTALVYNPVAGMMGGYHNREYMPCYPETAP